MHPGAPPRKAVGPTSAPTSALVALAVANIALAFGPWFVRVADTGPVAAGFWRMALGAPFIAALALGGGARPGRLGPGLWLVLLIGGVAFAADLASWHLGILRTTLANATLFGNSATLIYPIYGFLVARAWPTRSQGFALVLAAAGAMLLMGQSYQLDSRHLTGDLLCLLAGILYTGYFIAMARARESMAPLSSLTLSTLASIAPLGVFALLIGERIVPTDWTPLVALALVSQVLGQGCMIYALGKLSPLIVGIGLLIQPIVAATIGWLRYGERLGAADLVGAVLVAVALVLVRRSTAVARGPSHEHVGGQEAA